MNLTPLQHHTLKYKGILHDTLNAYLDTVYVDIARGATGQIEYVWQNVVLNASRSNIDAPDMPAATAPVVVNWTLHTKRITDLRNGDLVTVKIPDPTGYNIAEAYRGRIGDPYTSTSRKRTNLTMQQLGRDDIRDDVIPLPQPPEPEPDPEKYAQITVRFLTDAGDPLREDIIFNAEHDKELTIEAQEFHGMGFERAYFNGEEYGTDTITFTPADSEYEIEFIYAAIIEPLFIRQFANGRFRTDAGNITSGAHWYQAIPINYQGNDTLISPTDRQRHENIGNTMILRAGSRLFIEPQETFAEIVAISATSGGFMIAYREVAPTQAESNAYITNSYGIFGE